MFKSIRGMFTQYRGLSRSIYVVFFARAVTSMGAFIWPMLTLIMSGKLGYSEDLIGIIIFGTGILFIPANLIGGKLADHFNKKRLIIIFDLVSVACFIACGFLEPGTPMMVLFIIAGIFATMEWPSFEALFMEASKPAEREKAFSLSYLGHNLGFTFGAAIGGLLYANHLNLAFILDGMTTLASTILIVLFVESVAVEDMEEHEKNEYEDDAAAHMTTRDILWQRKSVLVQILVFTIASFIYDQWVFTIPLFVDHLYGAEEGGAALFGFLSSYNGLIVIVFTPVLTSMLKNLKELPKIMLGIGLYSLSFLIILGTPAQSLFFLMFFIFTIGEIINTLGASPFISRRIPATHRGRVTGYTSVGYIVGSTTGHLLAGFAIVAFGYNITFVAIAALGMITIGILVFNYRLDKRIFPKLYSGETVEAVDLG